MDPEPVSQSTKKNKKSATPAKSTVTNSRAPGSGPTTAAKTAKGPRKKILTEPDASPADHQGSVTQVDQPVPPMAGLAKPKKLATKVVAALTDEQKKEFAKKWGMEQKDARFVKAIEADKYYNFVKKLTDEQLKMVQLADIEAAQPLGTERWAERRKETVAFFDANMKDKWRIEWNLPRGDERLQVIFADQKRFDFFRSIEQIKYQQIITGEQIQHMTAFSDTAFKKANDKATAAREEKEKSKLAKLTDETQAERKAEFRRSCAKLKDDITQEMDDIGVGVDEWETNFDAEAARVLVVITKNQAAKVDKQLKELQKYGWEQVRQCAVKREARNYQLLKRETLDTLQGNVLADKKLQASDLASLCTDALREQRNPDALTLLKLLKLEVYETEKQSTLAHVVFPGKIGRGVHFRVDESGLCMQPTRFTADTTGLELLNTLFSAPSGDKTHNVHVTIETGVEEWVGGTKRRFQPHMYWGCPVQDLDIYYWDDIGHRKPKWTTAHTPQEVTAALQESMQTATNILVGRATNLIANACNPAAQPGTRRG